MRPSPDAAPFFGREDEVVDRVEVWELGKEVEEF